MRCQSRCLTRTIAKSMCSTMFSVPTLSGGTFDPAPLKSVRGRWAGLIFFYVASRSLAVRNLIMGFLTLLSSILSLSAVVLAMPAISFYFADYAMQNYAKLAWVVVGITMVFAATSCIYTVAVLSEWSSVAFSFGLEEFGPWIAGILLTIGAVMSCVAALCYCYAFVYSAMLARTAYQYEPDLTTGVQPAVWMLSRISGKIDTARACESYSS